MPCSRPVTMKITDTYGVQHYPTDIAGRPIAFPCGACIGCKTDKINQWTNRLNYELLNRTACFVALTYDDNHLRYNKGYFEPTLYREDLHKCIDNLRHFVGKHPDASDGSTVHFKYFAVGEYGSESNRPHYHVLIAGLSPQYVQMVLPKIWKYGSIDVKPVLNGAVRYVLKYMSKQQDKEYVKIHYTCFGLDAPFVSCSPGIGSEYFLAHAKDIRETGFIQDGGKNILVPNYWKNKVFNMTPSLHYVELMKKYKERINAEHDKFSDAKGYISYDFYLLEQARLRAVQEVNNLRTQGVPVEDYTVYGHLGYKIPKYFHFGKKLKEIAEKALDDDIPF